MHVQYVICKSTEQGSVILEDKGF